MTVREMKDSGVEWIGLIPEHWGTLSLQYLLSFSGSGTTPKRLDMLVCEDGNGINWLNTGDLTDGYIENIPQKLKTEVMHQYSTLRLYPSGSLVIALYGATAGKLGILLEPSTTNQACCVLVPNKDLLNLKYLFYQLFAARSSLISLAKGGGQPNISQETVRKFKVCFTDLQEQKKIANFLDSKCAEIDALKADIEKQIETLQEYKKSVITEAVTKGLEPNVGLKDSGVDWIGQIPKHWTVLKGKWFLSLLQRPTKETDEVITCFRDGEVTLRSNRREDGFTISLKECGYQGIEPGDIVVHGMDGFAGAIGISDSRGKASPVLNVLDTNLSKKFYVYYLRSMAFKGVFISLSTGIRVRSCDTGWNKLKNLPYPVPPLVEQQAISDFLDNKCTDIDALIVDIKKQIELLQEYKKSLINEAVTKGLDLLFDK